MRTRPSSRLIVLSPENRVLLFSFCHTEDALSGNTYWATPGGGLEHDAISLVSTLVEGHSHLDDSITVVTFSCCPKITG
jgi:hypothetical protein